MFLELCFHGKNRGGSGPNRTNFAYFYPSIIETATQLGKPAIQIGNSTRKIGIPASEIGNPVGQTVNPADQILNPAG